LHLRASGVFSLRKSIGLIGPIPQGRGLRFLYVSFSNKCLKHIFFSYVTSQEGLLCAFRLNSKSNVKLNGICGKSLISYVNTVCMSDFIGRTEMSILVYVHSVSSALLPPGKQLPVRYKTHERFQEKICFPNFFMSCTCTYVDEGPGGEGSPFTQ
jgi:hypothetical protein